MKLKAICHRVGTGLQGGSYRSLGIFRVLQGLRGVQEGLHGSLSFLGFRRGLGFQGFRVFRAVEMIRVSEYGFSGLCREWIGSTPYSRSQKVGTSLSSFP